MNRIKDENFNLENDLKFKFIKKNCYFLVSTKYAFLLFIIQIIFNFFININSIFHIFGLIFFII